ncbi:hypothetical protein [Trinickia acidisoli]|uniref:hypothetical protein n=1 Tax=Trinickia acidisoli TaxID=2767482 RepID=UPI001A8E2B25|nr:hypothetical protein [Trinickia acidisoli]
MSRMAALGDGAVAWVSALALAPASAKALIHAHAHKQPTNTFFKLMRVSALNHKSASRRRTGHVDQPGTVSIREPLAMPLPEKRPAPAAIRPFGSGEEAAANSAKQRERGVRR